MIFGFETELMIEFVRQYGIFAVMAGALIEEIIVPIPSPIVPMAAGVILIEANSLLPAMFQIFFLIAIPASVASVISSYFVYSIAFYGGEPLIRKYGGYLEVSWEEVQGLEQYFGTEREKYLVMLFRMIPIVPLSLVSGAAGLFRMDWKEYGIWSFFGMVPRNFFLALIGWYIGDGFIAMASEIDRLSTGVTVLIASVVVLWLIDRNSRKLYRRYLLG